ncbi:MAG: hypothetical protein HY877_00625 [Deltaproteobacteria bacterium]|nr:hypothetical protein [Deltaproteobacteria bacterium]
MFGGNCKCDVKTWVVQGFVIAVLYLGLDMFFHHYCMMKIYAAHAHLFRPLDAMVPLRWWGYLGYLVFGLLFVCIFAAGYEAAKSKVAQGLRYGLLIGLFYHGSSLLISAPYMPWPKRLLIDWFAIGVAECIILGFILGMLYKPKSA